MVSKFQVGFLKHGPNNNINYDNLAFSTKISKQPDPRILFSPREGIPYANDTDLIVRNSNSPNSRRRMDLEYGNFGKGGVEGRRGGQEQGEVGRRVECSGLGARVTRVGRQRIQAL